MYHGPYRNVQYVAVLWRSKSHTMSCKWCILTSRPNNRAVTSVLNDDAVVRVGCRVDVPNLIQIPLVRSARAVRDSQSMPDTLHLKICAHIA